MQIEERNEVLNTPRDIYVLTKIIRTHIYLRILVKRERECVSVRFFFSNLDQLKTRSIQKETQEYQLIVTSDRWLFGEDDCIQRISEEMI